MKQLLEGFEKIDVKVKSMTSAKERKVFIKQSGKTFHLVISRAAMEESGLQLGDKVDLYGKGGGAFAIVRGGAGMYKITGNGRNPARINATNLCLEIRARTHQCSEFTAWGIGGEGVLFFKPKEVEDGR